jgi:hypothetical protein
VPEDEHEATAVRECGGRSLRWQPRDPSPLSNEGNGRTAETSGLCEGLDPVRGLVPVSRKGRASAEGVPARRPGEPVAHGGATDPGARR